MLTNTYLSARRPKARRLEVLTDAPPERGDAAGGGPEERMVLWPHVTSLPPRQRAVVVLRYYEGLSEREIAETLECSTGTVKSTAHHALKALRAALGPDETDGRES
jgi:RNA polymerase sigma factor (sigma-70 family)